MPRVVDHEERRREITYAVWHLIATRGLGAVTQRAVAAEAGVSVGRIQHYFASKEEMVRYGCRALIDTAAGEFEERTSEVGPLEALGELIVHVIPQTEPLRIGATVWYAYLAASVGDPEISAILRDAKRGEQGEAVRLLREAQRAGQVDPTLDAESVAARLLSMADGLAMRVLVGQTDATEAVDALRRDFDLQVSGNMQCS